MRGADGGGAGDAAARLGGARSLLRRVRLAGRLLGARAAPVGSGGAARRSCIGAGGQATDLDGRPFDGETGRVLASNGRIHEQMMRILEDVARRGNTPWP